MGKWLRQAAEIEQLCARLSAAGADASVDAYGVNAEERTLISQGRRIEAIRKYRERTAADLLTAKNAIDSAS